MSFDQSFKLLLPWEGGYSNLKSDPGGATNLGIIQREYNHFRAKRGLPQQSVKFITKDEAREIYLTEYWLPMRCDELAPGVANCLFDSGVNSGTSRGVRWLQVAVNAVGARLGRPSIAVDEAIGPQTIEAANSLPADQLINEMLSVRLGFMKNSHNPETGEALWPVFGRGWADRIIGVRKQSHSLVGLPEPKPEPPFTIEFNFPQPLEKLTMFNLVATVLMGLWSNPQVKSWVRHALTGAAGALAIKAGLDQNAAASTAEAMAAGAFAVGGLGWSWITHTIIPAATSAASSPTQAASA